MSTSTRVLLALAAGIGAGLAANAIGGTASSVAIGLADPVGAIFVNAIRMTVVPLVVSSLIVGIASSTGGAGLARIGARGLVVFVLFLVASGLVGVLVAPPVLSHLSVDANAVVTLRTAAASSSGTATSAASVPSVANWIASLIAPNTFRAAVDGAMLPLIVFAMLFGLALLALDGPAREPVVAILRGTADSMLVIVRWLLVVAPIGVFALALPLVARLGLSAIGALATYVALVSLGSFVFMLLVVYPAAMVFGGVSLERFARAALPAQAVGFSSRSSIAALPALIETARTRLGLPDEIAVFFLPLATALFRVGATLSMTTGALFIARLYGVTIGASQLMTLLVISVLTSFSIPGIPGGSLFAMVPVLASVGLPISGIGILFGVDTIPDIFRTTANVTGQLAAATIVARGEVFEPVALPAPDAG